MSGCLHHQNLLHALEGSLSLEGSHALGENPFLVEILSLEESLHHHRHVSNLLHHFSLHPCEEGFLSLEVNLFLEVSLFLGENLVLGASHPSLEESHVLENGRLYLQGPKIPPSAFHVLSSHLHRLRLDLQLSSMPTADAVSVEENLHVLEGNHLAMATLALEESHVLEESCRLSILL